MTTYQNVLTTIRTNCDRETVVETLKTVFSRHIDGVKLNEVNVYVDGDEYIVERINRLDCTVEENYIDTLDCLVDEGDIECMLESLSFQFELVDIECPDDDEVFDL